MMIKRSSLFLIPSTIILASLSTQLWAADNVIEPPMMTIPSGEFLMGGNMPFIDGSETAPNELPIHKVTISTFKVAKYEVTVKEFRQFIEATGYKAPESCYHQPNEGWFSQGATKGSWDNNELTTNDYQPVVCVGWNDATAYAKWLSQKTNKNYRLLTEAEWEYAARAGSTTKFYFGDDPQQKNICEYANVSDKTAEQSAQSDYGATYLTFMGGTAQCDDQSGYASLVGMYKPNAFGVFDLIGNINEYLQDCDNKGYKGAPIDGSAWLTGNCEHRMLRGGAWHWRGFSSGTRSPMPLTWVGAIEGFRLAQTISVDAVKTKSNATIQFEKDLAKAQKKERLRRQKLLPFPSKTTGLTFNKSNEDSSIKLSWNANSEPEVTGYNVYRSQAFGSQYIKIASNISQLEFIDKIPPARKHSYKVAAVNPEKFGQYSDVVTTADTINIIPGTVQAEDFNQMQGVGIGTIKEEEDIGGGLNLTGAGGINKGDWTEYLIDVKSSGFYGFKYRIASADGSDGFELLLDDELKATLAVPATGGWRKWQTATGQKFHLKAGQHKLKMKAIASGWKLNWFNFEAS